MLLVFEEIEWFQLLKIVQKRNSSKPATVSESEPKSTDSYEYIHFDLPEETQKGLFIWFI